MTESTGMCSPRYEPLATIVGLGAVSPLGLGVMQFWHALFDPPAGPDRNVIGGFAGHSDDLLRHAYATRGNLPCRGEGNRRKSNRFEQMMLAALGEAFADAQWGAGQSQKLTLGLLLSTAAGDTETAETAACLNGAQHTAYFAEHNGYRLLDDLIDTAMLPDIRGPVMSVSNACAASLYALTLAGEFIKNGMADAICVVGADMLSRVTQAAFQRMSALDPERCRPFDAHRCGTVFGEGAVAILLVSPRVAMQFPRRYCNLLAYGLSCDAHHPTAPHPDGRDVRVAAQRALEAAHVDPCDIGFVFPHGTGTPLNDRIEGQLLGTLFAQSRHGSFGGVAVFPVKAYVGHCAGASGSFSVLVAAMALAEREIPAATYVSAIDPEIPVSLPSRLVRLDETGGICALVNAYGFGGTNTSVVLGVMQ